MVVTGVEPAVQPGVLTGAIPAWRCLSQTAACANPIGRTAGRIDINKYVHANTQQLLTVAASLACSAGTLQCRPVCLTHTASGSALLHTIPFL